MARRRLEKQKKVNKRLQWATTYGREVNDNENDSEVNVSMHPERNTKAVVSVLSLSDKWVEQKIFSV